MVGWGHWGGDSRCGDGVPDMGMRFQTRGGVPDMGMGFQMWEWGS